MPGQHSNCDLLLPVREHDGLLGFSLNPKPEGGQAGDRGPAGHAGRAAPGLALRLPGAADAGRVQPLVPDVRRARVRVGHAQGAAPAPVPRVFALSMPCGEDPACQPSSLSLRLLLCPCARLEACFSSSMPAAGCLVYRGCYQPCVKLQSVHTCLLLVQHENKLRQGQGPPLCAVCDLASFCV